MAHPSPSLAHRFRLPMVTWLLLAIGMSVPAIAEGPSAQPVSFHRQIRPILQAHCQGCHQPAKADGDYVMTQFERLVKGGESGSAAIVPGKPEESRLVEMITPEDGEAAMPQGKPPLDSQSIALIVRWIREGANDDTPPNAGFRYDQDHPPIYALPPVITSLDYSPDGKWLAVAGFHEVLLHRADGGLAARLIGLAERIESVSFSPDGKRLAVTGGLPGRAGELQIWELTESTADGQAQVSAQLSLSIPVTHDTIYGGKWSPDGKLVVVGCADNSVRAFDTESGEQVLFQGAHNDWVLDAVFSVDGKHLMSVGRDMSAKLIEVATERFVDNITSITPGALKGGIQAVARHPLRDEIVIGGADGVPKVYRVFRQTPRRIGDDANLIRRLPPLQGRIFAVAVSHDGKRIASASSLNGKGQLAIDGYEFDTGLTDELKKIMSKVASTRTPDERKKLEAYRTEGLERYAIIDLPTGIFALDFHPDGKTLAAAGFDGKIRLIDPATGKVRKSFDAAQVSPRAEVAHASSIQPVPLDNEDSLAEQVSLEQKVARLTASPDQIMLRNPFDYVQLVVTATLDSGESIDVTRAVTFRFDANITRVTRRGLVLARGDGQTELRIEFGGQTLVVPVTVTGVGSPFVPDFIRDVAPVIAKLGCNQGTCHGAAKGKNGFKLSLRGYDPLVDVRAFTDDHASRRANIASPDDSLMLLKATSAVPHMGGRRMQPGDDAYRIIRDWIAAGARLQCDSARVARIEVLPRNPVIEKIGARQQFRVLATYADGTQRDVTRQAFITSGDGEIAKEDHGGLLTSVRRGEAPVLARYEGAYAATTLTVMGDRSGFRWQDPDQYNRIDALVAAKWKRMKITPSDLADDATFLRRVHLDLTGLPPSAEAVQAFLDDTRSTEIKRAEVIDRLIGSPEYVDYWSNKWADLLMVNRKYLGAEGAKAFRDWIRAEIEQNTPYDEFARKIVTATGSNRENPAASYFKILRTPDLVMETTTQLFLAIRFNCNKCHDHPFERWTQDQYYHTAAFFARVELKADPASKGRKIGGSAVEGAKPLYEFVQDKAQGEITHLRTGETAAPEFPYDCKFEAPKGATRRQRFAAWLTSPDNPYFARSYVNRIWGYLMGRGLIEPLDDIRAGNPPTNPELLDYLTEQFIRSGMDTRQLMRLICQSRTYQLSLQTNRWNEDDAVNYSHALARRLPAEVIFDALHFVTDATPKLPGVPKGTRAAQLPDVGVKLPSGFLDTLGRPPRQSACECERVNEVQLGVVMALINGPVVADAIGQDGNALARLAADISEDDALIRQVFLRILNRPPDDEEIELARQVFQQIADDHAQLTSALKEREAWWAKKKAELEKQRLADLSRAKSELVEYRKKIEPKLAKARSERELRIAKAEAEWKAYQAKVPQLAADAVKKRLDQVEWHPLVASSVKGGKGATFVQQADRSILATGSAEKMVYTVRFRTRLPRITAIRLEALPIPGRKGGGPGLSDNGNFVVTEFEVFAKKGKDSKFAPVSIAEARADFSQQGFSPKQMIDNKLRDQRGWAIHPAMGIDHWATFQLANPIESADGIELEIRIHQFHNAKDHRLGRFRISVADEEKAVGTSLSESLRAIAMTAAEERTGEQQESLLSYFRKTSNDYRKRAAALAEAKKPLPPDPGIVAREAKIAQLEKPTPDDRRLVQLRLDVAASRRQLENRRLTAVQDLAWALINSPAFLFNH